VLAGLVSPGAFLQVPFANAAGTIRGVSGHPPLVLPATIRAMLAKQWLELAAGDGKGQTFYRITAGGRIALFRARTSGR
jgi:hypothetical protein